LESATQASFVESDESYNGGEEEASSDGGAEDRTNLQKCFKILHSVETAVEDMRKLLEEM
jgi:hypothetical protein